MFIFWFKATWRDLDGWEITYTLDGWGSSRKEVEKRVEGRFKWLERKLPSSFRFIGIELIKTEEVLGTEPIEMEEI